MSICSDDYIVFGGDRRLCRGYGILKRDVSRIHKLTEDTYILSWGMYSDIINLWKVLDERIRLYQLNYGEKLDTQRIASMLSRVLYYKRFFPYYTFNIIVGKQDGRFVSFDYDAIGSMSRLKKVANCGNSSEIIGPMLENQLEGYNLK